MHSRLALRGRHLLVADTLCVAVAFVLGFALRLDAPSDAFQSYLTRFAWLLLPLLIVRIVINLYFRLYQRLWRYASVEEMQAIVLATSTGSLLFGLVVLAFSFGGPNSPAYGFPRSVVAIEWLLSTAFLGGVRFSLRTAQAGRWVGGERVDPTGVHPPKRVLVVGAGDAGAAVVKELRLRTRLAMQPVGLVDDDPDKLGKWIHEVPVVGSCREIPSLVTRLQADTVIIGMPSAPGSVIRDILQACERIGVSVMTVPGIAELISGKVIYGQIRPVQLEDLLRREPAHLDLESIAGYLGGATVMVTGAGGSIGSELCRQIVDYHPAQLLLLGRGENSIYTIHEELRARPNGTTELVPLIADIRDAPRVKGIIGEYRPSVVFHAAAHKHVPLMETNPSEAVAVNIFGTKNLLDASVDVGVESFVLVSTDKAVNPTNVMGATKRVAELLLQETATRTGRRYVAVRFGNVLGSRGSVVPLFRQQIQNGGPVTVTHPEITRYFMTIPESVQLIIQAAALGRGSEIFVLDMGQPIKIIDLAQDLIRLSGLEPYRDIEIKITGLRPGEKLYEELFTVTEKRVSTKNSRIFMSTPQLDQNNHLDQELMELSTLMSIGEFNINTLRTALARIVPEYYVSIDNCF